MVFVYDLADDVFKSTLDSSHDENPVPPPWGCADKSAIRLGVALPVIDRRISSPAFPIDVQLRSCTSIFFILDFYTYTEFCMMKRHLEIYFISSGMTKRKSTMQIFH